jgi:hypothetical protein
MLRIVERIKADEDTGALVTCLLMAACVIMPLITVVWCFGSSFAWFWEVMCFALWAGLFWWTAGPSPLKEAAAHATEAMDKPGESELDEYLLEKFISRKE